MKQATFYSCTECCYIVAELDAERHADLDANLGADHASGEELQIGSDASQAGPDASQEQAPSRSAPGNKRKKRSMVRTYSSSSNGSQSSSPEQQRPHVRQPRMDRKQKQQNQLIKGLGKALSSAMAETERATTQRHQDAQQQMMCGTQVRSYNSELRSYNSESKTVFESNGLGMHMQQRADARQHGILLDAHDMLPIMRPPTKPVAPVFDNGAGNLSTGAEATSTSAGGLGSIAANVSASVPSNNSPRNMAQATRKWKFRLESVH